MGLCSSVDVALHADVPKNEKEDRLIGLREVRQFAPPQDPFEDIHSLRRIALLTQIDYQFSGIARVGAGAAPFPISAAYGWGDRMA